MATTFPFPANPSTGQQVALSSGQMMYWTGYSWEMVVAGGTNYGQGNSSFVLVSPLVDANVVPMPSPIGKGWSLLNYV